MASCATGRGGEYAAQVLPGARGRSTRNKIPELRCEPTDSTDGTDGTREIATKTENLGSGAQPDTNADVVRKVRNKIQELLCDPTDGTDGTDETREIATKTEKLGSGAQPDTNAGVVGKVVVPASILPPPGTTPEQPPLPLYLLSLEATPTPAGRTLPAPALAAPEHPQLVSRMAKKLKYNPVKINPEHVVGKAYRVKYPSLPVKKHPLWHDEALQDFNPLLPVKRVFNEILLKGPPASVLSLLEPRQRHPEGWSQLGP